MTELKLAIEKAGSQQGLAAALGIHKSAVSQWIRRNRVPAVHAIKMQELYGIDAAAFMVERKQPEAVQ
jgi:DNA-binding transcriptional regulator YdaS (Cro superfamily)